MEAVRQGVGKAVALLCTRHSADSLWSRWWSRPQSGWGGMGVLGHLVASAIQSLW